MTDRVPSTLRKNLTPHNIIVQPTGSGPTIFYARSDIVARLNTKEQGFVKTLEDGSPVYTPQIFTSVFPRRPQLTNEQIGVIVSMPVAEWIKKKKGAKWAGNVYCADTGPEGVLRDERGVIIGTKRLVQYV
jgi:hypothetical protein